MRATTRRAFLAASGSAALVAGAVGDTAHAGPTNRFGSYRRLQSRLNDQYLVIGQGGGLDLVGERAYDVSRIGWDIPFALNGSTKIEASDAPGRFYVRIAAAIVDPRGYAEQELGFVHIENGSDKVQVGPAPDGWWSAQWLAEDVPSSGSSVFLRFRNRWKPQEYLYAEHLGLVNGRVRHRIVSGPVAPGSWPSIWRFG